MDKKKSFINVFISLFFKIILLITSLITIRCLIKYAGNDANGINSLYVSIIGMLSVAELGIGGSIAYSMYKPIVNGDNNKIAALYQLYVKVYKIIGIVIGILGLVITPLIPYLARDYTSNFNLYFTFILMLISVVLTYTYSAKSSLINAYKNNYITTTIFSIGQLVQEILQITLLIIFKSFELYIGSRIVASLVQLILTNIYTKKTYKQILAHEKEELDIDTKKEIIRNTKASLMHRIGGILVNSTDSVIISAFIGVSMLGKYSNYLSIMTSMTGLLTLFFSPLTSIMGHLCAKGNRDESIKWFNFFHSLNFVIGIIFFLGYFMIIDDVIRIFFETTNSGSLILVKNISFVITLNYFIQFMRQAGLLFRDATGTFYHDRWKPLVEGIINLILSIIFVFVFGIVGVIISTIITNLFVCHVVEPYVLFKNGFKSSPKKYYVKNYLFIAIFFSLLSIACFVKFDINNIWLSILANGFFAIGVALIPIMVLLIVDKKFRNSILQLIKFLREKIFGGKIKKISIND